MAPPKDPAATQSLLSSDAYDDDASTLRNPSTSSDDRNSNEAIMRGPSQDYEEEHRRLFDSLDDDDLVVHHSEVQTNDNNDEFDVLREEEERERLLSKKSPGLFGSLGRKKGKRVLVGSMREDYEMEEGYKQKQKKKGMRVYDVDHRESRRPTLLKLAVYLLGLFALLVALIFGALHYSASSLSPFAKSIISNGTHNFHPTTILVSLDGFRADFLLRGITPTLQRFIDAGISPAYMLPSFPSVTFPNHYTIVTGMYPESHGIVGNTFWDPKLQREFFYTHPDAMDTEWWGGEPIWLTAEKQGMKSAVHMWPGSEAHIGGRDPTYLDKFNKSEKLPNKVHRVMEWLDMDIQDRPQFIATYVPHIDVNGHKFGPNSTEVNQTIALVDDMLELMFKELAARNLTDLVNVIVTSDHGMATTSNERLIYLDDIIDISLIEHMDGWPLYGLRPYENTSLSDLHNVLVNESKSVPKPHWEVYLKEDMPERYHFKNNDRIAPLWIIPESGYAIVTRAEHDISKTDKPYSPRGVHGYDNLHPLMRAIFVARGPAFPHPPGTQVEPFGNWEIYSILCHSLGLKEASIGNNGTMSWSTGGGFTYVQRQKIEDAGDLPAIGGISTLPPPKPTSFVDDSIFDQISDVKVAIDEPTYIPQPDRPTESDAPSPPSSPSPPLSPSSPTPPVTPSSTSQEVPVQDSTESEQDPSTMSWAEYIKWKADRLTEDVQHFWDEIWGS